MKMIINSIKAKNRTYRNHKAVPVLLHDRAHVNDFAAQNDLASQVNCTILKSLLASFCSSCSIVTETGLTKNAQPLR